VPNQTALHVNRAALSTMLRPRNDFPPPLISPRANRRARIWEISQSLHCSIVGTCLSAAELRQFFVRVGDADAKTASDHKLHGRGVLVAGRHDQLGKLLHKTLDNRHEGSIKRFAKATTAAELGEFWHEAFDQGAISGAYWAVLTHPEVDRPLVEKVFGEVHMLSHMVGSASRVDIARLRQLERDLGDRDDKIARQQARLADNADVRTALQRKIEALEADIRRRAAAESVAPGIALDLSAAASVQLRLDSERAHAEKLASRVEELEHQVGSAQEQVSCLQERNDRLQHEVAALEAMLGFDEAAARDREPTARDLTGVTLLYVGGRPGLIDQLKALTASRGGTLLSHDGGIEDNVGVLPGLVSRADAALFPVDCVSHTAVGLIKKLCRNACKPLVPLRSASVASFIAAIGAEDALRQLTPTE